jgi:hypothetical protein
MFGFLNVLLTVAAVRADFSKDDAIALLEEGGRAVCFDGDGVTWRNRVLPLRTIERARDSVASFGSCSFREPVQELRAMSLL